MLYCEEVKKELQRRGVNVVDALTPLQTIMNRQNNEIDLDIFVTLYANCSCLNLDNDFTQVMTFEILSIWILCVHVTNT